MRPLIITHVGVQQGLGLPTLADRMLRVDDGVITAIDAAGECSPELRATCDVIDGTGKTLMPGMVFAHAHIAYDNVRGAREVLFKNPPTRAAYLAAGVAKRALHAGYTTMVGAGSICGIDVFLREAIRQGLFVGPRLIPCSRDLMAAAPLGKRSREKVAHIPRDYMPIIVEDDELEASVIKEIDDGAEIIKTFATGDDQFPNARSQDELFSREELAKIVSLAHARGIMVRCHARGRQGILNALDAGVDIIDHATYMDERCLERIKAQQVTIVPSYYQPIRYLAEGAQFGRDPGDSQFQQEIDNTASFLPTAEQMGITIAVGEDFGFAWTPHGTYVEELICYATQMRIPPVTILKWATSNGARMIRQDNHIGHLGKGQIADMILLSEDPSVRIQSLKTAIERVFIAGVQVPSDAS